MRMSRWAWIAFGRPPDCAFRTEGRRILYFLPGDPANRRRARLDGCTGQIDEPRAWSDLPGGVYNSVGVVVGPDDRIESYKLLGEESTRVVAGSRLSAHRGAGSWQWPPSLD